MNFLILPPKSGKTRVLKNYSFATFLDKIKGTGFFSDKSVFDSDDGNPDNDLGSANIGFPRFNKVYRLDVFKQPAGNTVELPNNDSDSPFYYVPLGAINKDFDSKALKYHEPRPIDCVIEDNSILELIKRKKEFYFDDYEYFVNHPSNTISYSCSLLINERDNFLDALNGRIFRAASQASENRFNESKVRMPILFFRNGSTFEANFNPSPPVFEKYVTHCNYFQIVTGYLFKWFKKHDYIQLAGVIVRANDEKDTVVLNHNAFESVRFAGLPYIAVSEGGAYEPDMYSAISDVPVVDNRCDGITLFKNKFDVIYSHLKDGANEKQNANIRPHELYRFEFDREITPAYWLLNVNRCFIDSLLTTIFKSSDGATLKGGLSATVMELLARYNHGDGISAYTPTESDALTEQLSSGYLNGVIFFKYNYKTDMHPEMFTTTRWMDATGSVTRDSVFVVLQNGVSIGNCLAFDFKDATLRLCQKYSAATATDSFASDIDKNKHTLNLSSKRTVKLSRNLLDFS